MKGMTRRELEITDRNEIRSILDTCGYLHLGLCDGDEPYVVPMNYGYELNEDGKLTFYLHGAVWGRKLDIIRKNPKIFAEMECGVQPFEGDVACRYGISYRSLMARGQAVLVDDPAEKMRAMSILMKTQTGGDFTFTEKLVKVVSVIRLDISEYTAKYRPMPKPRSAASEDDA